jgi:Protein of unknown function (DUF2846)
MRVSLVAFLFAAITSASAQNPFGPLPRACGPNDVSFTVKLDKSSHSLTPPEPGKARIYFLQDTGVTAISSSPTEPTMFGVDGAWVGAIHGKSYFSMSIDPGEHHLCAALKFNREGRTAVLAHLQVEAGRTYFYRMRLIEDLLGLDPVDSDEGSYLIANYPLSVFQPRK